MARRKLIAANWKMNKTIAEADAFATALVTSAGKARSYDLAVFPPFFAVPTVAARLRSAGVAVGAQDLYWEKGGAYTGEISADMIVDAGGTHVIVGHSERRHIMGEGDDVVGRKLRAALDGGLIPVFCVGEKLEHREAGDEQTVVGAQLTAGIAELSADDMSRTVIAYEPVWAIGTGRTATPDDADAMHRFVRGFVEQRFGEGVASTTRILYGGSVKPGNAAGLLGRQEIDGALIGGASLELESFLGIATAV